MIDFFAGIGAFFVYTWFSTFSPHHTPATECGQRGELSYCYYAGAPDATRTVYFLHGFGNGADAWTWNSVTKRIEETWKALRLPRPHVVSLSFGKVWWYNDARGMQLERFVHAFEREKKLPHDRAVYGDSMGGHNSFRWAAGHAHLFQKLALICPAVPRRFAGEPAPGSEGLWPFTEFAGLAIGRLYSGEAKKPLMNPTYWGNLKRIPHVYVAVTDTDHYGFHQGGVELHRAFQDRGHLTVFDPQSVRHCDVRADKLAPFLAH